MLLPGSLAVDVLAFIQVVRTDDLTGAVRLYRGPLLDGFEPPLAEFDEWLRPERRRLEDMAVTLAERASLVESTAADPPDVAGFCHRLLARDRLLEPVYRALMRLLVRAGDRIEALKTYALCKAALAEDLGVGPSPETEAIHREIIAGGDAPKRHLI